MLVYLCLIFTVLSPLASAAAIAGRGYQEGALVFERDASSDRVHRPSGDGGIILPRDPDRTPASQQYQRDNASYEQQMKQKSEADKKKIEDDKEIIQSQAHSLASVASAMKAGTYGSTTTTTISTSQTTSQTTASTIVTWDWNGQPHTLISLYGGPTLTLTSSGGVQTTYGGTVYTVDAQVQTSSTATSTATQSSSSNPDSGAMSLAPSRYYFLSVVLAVMSVAFGAFIVL